MWTEIYLVSVVTVLVWLLPWTFYWKIRKVKYLFPLPIFGNSLTALFLGKVGFIQYLYNQFPGEKYFGLHMFTRPVLFIKDPKLLQQLLVTDFDYFSATVLYANKDRDPIAKTILALNGEKWKELKRKLSQCFTPAKVKSILDSLGMSTTKMDKTIENQIRNNEPIEMESICVKLAVDITYQSLFGIETDCWENANSKFCYIMEEVNSGIFHARLVLGTISPKTFDFFKMNLCTDKLMSFLKEIIIKIVDFRTKENIHRQDFFQTLMNSMDERNDSSNMSNLTNTEEIMKSDLPNAIAFIGAGTKSVALTTTCCLYELALHPDIQEKCRNEVLSVIKEAGSEHITADLATSLPYLSAVVKETLRMHTFASSIGRQCTKDYKLFGTDLTIEKGTYVLCSAAPIHMDEKYFPKPNEFQPERFLNVRDTEGTSGTYFPFGLGPRMCAGVALARIELNMILSRMLQNYEFKVCKKTAIPMKYSKRTFVLTPIDGLWLNVHKINTNICNK